MRKRTLIIAAFLIAAGAIVNVAVARACVWAWRFARMHEVDSASAVASIVLPDGPDRFQCTGFENEGLGLNRISVNVRWFVPNAQPAFMSGQIDAWRAGWPSYSLIGWMYRFDGEAPRNVGCVVLINSDNEYLGVFPYRPLWPGFAINTVFYGAILWGLFLAPFELRKRRRIKRRLCPKCAYPVGTNDVCTECGAAVKAVRL